MNARTSLARNLNLRFRTLQYVFILMTTFILAGVICVLTIDSLSVLFADQPVANLPGGERLASHGSEAKVQETKPVAAPQHAKANEQPMASQLTRQSFPSGTDIKSERDRRRPHEDSHVEAQELPAPLFRPATIHYARQPEPSSLIETILAVGAILALAIVAALVFAFSFFALLRRHCRHFGPLLRIEYASALPMADRLSAEDSTEVATSPPESADHRDSPMSAETVAAHTAKASDFGGAFDAEWHRMEAAVKQQETAMLQHLFEDNLKLQAAIGEAPRG